MVVKIIIEMVRMKLEGSDEGIGSLIEDLDEPLESMELRMNVLSEPRHAKAKAIEAIEAFRNYIEVFINSFGLVVKKQFSFIRFNYSELVDFFPPIFLHSF